MNALKYLRDGIIIFIGTMIYAFGLVFLNMANGLAEGGVAGVSLLLKAIFNIDPAYSTFLINVPLILIGGKILGKRSFYYTLLGTTALSVCLWIWQRVPLTINLQQDFFIVAVLAGLLAGFGSGLVYKVGGTTGGSDIIARLLEKKWGIPMGRSLFIFDIFVLVLSLTYIDLKLMMYTLLASYVFSRVISFLIDGGYAAKGLLIVSDKSAEIAEALMLQLDRGVTFLEGKGGFSGQSKQIVYIVVSPTEITKVKRIINQIDAAAFFSVLNVHEVEGEGFSYQIKATNPLAKKNNIKKVSENL